MIRAFLRLLPALALAGLPGALHALQDRPEVAVAPDGVVVRVLDMLDGNLADLEIRPGETVSHERLQITLTECRYPVENPAADAFAYLKIRDVRESEDRFDGWMTAASPALSAMDHPRYDVWVLRCITPAAESADGG